MHNCLGLCSTTRLRHDIVCKTVVRELNKFSSKKLRGMKILGSKGTKAQLKSHAS